MTTWLSAEEVGGVPAGLVQRAKDLATRAHAGQVDKAGRPYIEHVARVAAAVRHYAEPEVQAVAWLHDVLEDCPGFSDEVYRMPVEVMWACCLLDRTRAPSHAYYARIARNPLALCVKLADIADNADESRLAMLDEKTAARLRRKYAKAREALGAK
jgi:hypothetical protein